MSKLTFPSDTPTQKIHNPMIHIPKLLLIFVLATSLLACKNTPSDKGAPEVVSQFGEPFDTTGMISYTELLTQMDNTDSLYAKVYGKVEAVCQTKGCWMDILPHDDAPVEKELFVQFKDYGFFMPKDLAGHKVAMEGYAYRETTSVEDLRHYAEDEGLSQEDIDAITEPEVQIKFMASGVKIINP
jgi:hypothetical protein